MITLDYATITPELAVGSYPATPEDILHLQSLGYTAVLSVQSDADLDERAASWERFWRFYTSRGMTAVRVPIIDFDASDLAKNLAGAVDALDKLVKSGRRVYLHCTAGINRSPTVAIAWMMQETKQPLAVVLASVQAARPSVRPAIATLEKWERRK